MFFVPTTCMETTDYLWPTDNDLGVPLLDRSMQATEVPHPIAQWGAVGRRSKGPRGWLHYVDDFKFDCHWRDPMVAVRTHATHFGECNYSLADTSPLAVAAYQTYRKRWLARYWQSKGLRTWVDLYVPPQWREVNLLGVPRGWGAYCTRAADTWLDDLRAEHELARERADGVPLCMVVYGGGRQVREYCAEAGLVYLPHAGHAARQRKSEAI